MKNITFKKLRFIAGVILLTSALLIALCACNVEEAPTETTEEAETTEAPAVKFTLDSRYKIIRSDTSKEAVKAAQYLRSAIEKVTGELLEFETDWVRKGEEVIAGEYEILVGTTNRKESEELSNSLRKSDWCYVAKEGQILICGGDEGSTFEAAKAFCKDIFGYTEDDPGNAKTIEIESGTRKSYAHTYSVSSVSLAGHPITDYVIAVPNIDNTYRELAAIFNELLSEESGFRLSLKDKDELSEGQLYIELGSKDAEYSPFKYTISADGDILSITGDKSVLEVALRSYFGKNSKKDGDKITLSLPEKAVSGYGGEQNGLVLSKEVSDNITDGVVYKKLTYLDENGKHVIAYVLVVDTGKASIINGTPNGGDVLHNVKATTVDAANAAKAQGYSVLCGVNADFFRISGDYSPRGICVKNGKELSVVTTRPFFGVKADGTPFIGEGTEYASVKGSIVEAVGGSDVILKNGKINDIDYGADFGYTRHPRTAVGYDKSGKIYIVVVDGRQPALSNGASLTDLAIIFTELGATDALNLDGGGSSTFILGSGNGFKTMNSPSDGNLRKVYNSLLVVKK